MDGMPQAISGGESTPGMFSSPTTSLSNASSVPMLLKKLL